MSARSHTCKQCRRRMTLNGKGVCTPCLNGEVPPHAKKYGELVDESDTPVDQEFLELTRTLEYRVEQAKRERNRKGDSAAYVPSVRRLLEISEVDFLEGL